MNEANAGQVEVLSIDGMKYVTSESFFKVIGIASEKAAHWISNTVKNRKLIRGVDFIDSDEGVLFTFEAATRLFENIKKPKKVKPSSQFSKRGYPLDEYGLPILPPQKRQGALINPYRI
jgi:hypothetical protein